MPTDTAEAPALEMLTPNPVSNWTGLDQLPFELIADRELTLEHDGEKGPLLVSFGKPTPIEGKAWCCLYRLSSMGRDFVGAAAGADSVHALQQAMDMVHNQLSAMARSHTITFLGQPNWGFSRSTAPEAPTTSAARCPVMNMSLNA